MQKPSYCTQPVPAETTAVNYLAAFTLHTVDTDLAKNESKASNKISEWYNCRRVESDKQLHKSKACLRTAGGFPIEGVGMSWTEVTFQRQAWEEHRLQ